MIKCYVCNINDINCCDCVYHLEGVEQKAYYTYVQAQMEKMK